MATGDPTEISVWRPLRILLRTTDQEIEKLYRERGLTDVRTRFTMPLIRLKHRGPMTIRELATSLDVTHSAMSQTVSALKRDGFVETTPGKDGRTRAVTLTKKARELIPFLEAEWRATETAVQELEDELPYPMSRVVNDIEQALAKRPFRDRVAAHLQEPE